MKTDEQACDSLTVLYDGACPLCRTEIAHLQRLAKQQDNTPLCFLDISQPLPDQPLLNQQRDQLLARFHVQKSDGTRLSGAAAFTAMWAYLPGWRWLAKLAQLPGVLPMLEWAYVGFLKVRPGMQWLAKRFIKTA